jgi:uncharacterized membrane protein HdeD (DUF308 family)
MESQAPQTAQRPGSADLEWDRLREEVLQAQSVRSDLLKWKLLLVGALSAAGLGLAGSRKAGHADLVLCAVPVVCLYVDLLAYHLTLRILVIGTYFRHRDTAMHGQGEGYEAYAQRARQLGFAGRDNRLSRRPPSAFDLEDWAVSWSTIFLSLSVVGYGIFVAAHPSGVARTLAIPFLLSGIVGVVVSLTARRSYAARFDAVNSLS